MGLVIKMDDKLSTEAFILLLKCEDYCTTTRLPKAYYPPNINGRLKMALTRDATKCSWVTLKELERSTVQI